MAEQDFEKLILLQNALEEDLLDRLGEFIKQHPEVDSSRFAVAVFLALAGRVGLSHLGAETTAEFMEVVADSVRRQGIGPQASH